MYKKRCLQLCTLYYYKQAKTVVKHDVNCKKTLPEDGKYIIYLHYMILSLLITYLD